MLVNWGRLLILLQCAAMLSTASISIWFCSATVRQGDTAMPDRLHARLCHAFSSLCFNMLIIAQTCYVYELFYGQLVYMLSLIHI